eukprot:4056421-Lingulodinium_polyedra.AAC.1
MCIRDRARAEDYRARAPLPSGPRPPPLPRRGGRSHAARHGPLARQLPGQRSAGTALGLAERLAPL